MKFPNIRQRSRSALISLVLLVGFQGNASYAAPAVPRISPDEYRAAVAYFNKHSDPREAKRFEDYPPERKAFYLGNTYWFEATKNRDWIKTDDEGKKSHERAKRFLLSAAAEPGELNQVELGAIYHNLAQIEHVRGNFAKAETLYRKSMEFDNEEACVNLGVMWERRSRYDKALSVYHGCLPKLKSSVLLLNLGAIYYNGLGRPRDHQKGAAYWQQSFELFAYDPDTNYNLGLHHDQDTNNHQKARYHYVLADRLGDPEAKGKLARHALRSTDASPLFAQELLGADADRRRWKIDGRLKHLLGDRYLGFPKEGFTFRQDENGNNLVMSGAASPHGDLSKALSMMFLLTYVDPAALTEDERERIRKDLVRDRHLTFEKHGIRHRVVYGKDEMLAWEVRFE